MGCCSPSKLTLELQELQLLVERPSSKLMFYTCFQDAQHVESDFSADGGQVEKEVDTEPLGAFDQVAKSTESNLHSGFGLNMAQLH